MHFVSNNKLLFIGIVFFIIVLLVLLANVLTVVYGGKSVAAPEIPREAITIGNGKELKYMILGDSTSIAQGGVYSKGFVVKTAENLSNQHRVIYQNYGVSGARINDVAVDQIERSKDFVPDIVLVAVGANDVTHLTSLDSIETDMKAIINSLRDRNKNIKIVFTGAASMGDVKRFIQPLKWILGNRTKSVNVIMEKIALENGVTFAYIARETGQKFADNPQYFAEDNFHPNNEGYAIWTEVLIPVINKIIN